jgi:phosphatidate cytidylyltransferase
MSGASDLAAPSTLRQRTLTAFVMGPLVIAAILLLPTGGFAVFVGLIVLTAAWEWAALGGLQRPTSRGSFVGLVLAGLVALWLVEPARFWLVAAAALWWALKTIQVARVRAIDPRPMYQPKVLAEGALILFAPWAALVDLHASTTQGPLLVLFLMMLVWTADSLAYFVGRRWGRAKLAPAVSPGKTRAGVYGALGGAAAWGLLLGLVLDLGVAGTLMAALLCALTVTVSVVGDLYESLLKRRRGLKDSSRLLPGHGGMLDRIDSLTAAAPVFVLGLGMILGGA